ncbi:hypothetical protein Nepgr_022028 [Nepenthes gracilis]|uniref:EF-hand domain-containing protein n=1 Tax=Nepenthes gracilis TaxID=150966 RepID=A0AAD3XWF4_NEPGR|nr:hypothetical protein Nepgr_022028 [Nepenthes gracilis]
MLRSFLEAASLPLHYPCDLGSPSPSFLISSPSPPFPTNSALFFFYLFHYSFLPNLSFRFSGFSHFRSAYSAMKLIKSISPKRLFRSKKSRSEPPSFNTANSFSSDGSASSSWSDKKDRQTHRSSTPTSVLPARSCAQEITREISGGWSNGCGDLYYELAEAFKLIDRDGDGRITKPELEALFCSIGASPPSDEEIEAMLREIDRDGDGCISLEEFCAVSPAFVPASDSAELREAFDVFDADHDGKITAEELLNVLTAILDERCTLEDCRGMIKNADKNGDGFVCFEDFALMMEHQRG